MSKGQNNSKGNHWRGYEVSWGKVRKEIKIEILVIRI